MLSMKLILFIIAISFELFYLLMFVLTIKLPGFSFWPPPSARSWQFFVSWIIASLVAVFFLLLGLLDFDSFFLHNFIRFPVALLLIIFGSVIGTWSYITLGFRTTIGIGDQLKTSGPYKHFRNPQYIGDIVNIMAYVVLTNSWMVWVIGALGVVLNILAPFAEEPWLEAKFGSAYVEYKRSVPRFVGLVKKKDAA